MNPIKHKWIKEIRVTWDDTHSKNNEMLISCWSSQIRLEKEPVYKFHQTIDMEGHRDSKTVLEGYTCKIYIEGYKHSFRLATEEYNRINTVLEEAA